MGACLELSLALAPWASEASRQRSSSVKTGGKMAAGSGAASGHGARSSSAALEATLDRRFQGVSNTMESIQGLSTWCIENKKHHALIVRYWMKWLKKCKSLGLQAS